MTAFTDMDPLFESGLVAGPVAEADIEQAERELDVRFPPGYRYFLMHFGAALGDGFEIAGLFERTDDSVPPQWSNVVLYTQQLRRAAKGMLPSGYVAISDDGGDYVYYIDTGHCRSDGEARVVALGPGVDGVTIAVSFADFALKVGRNEIVF